MRYLGSWAMITDVLSKFGFVYGTLARFDVLMQSFYKIQQARVKFPLP